MPSYLYKVSNSTYKLIDKISLSGWKGLVWKIYSKKKIESKLSTDESGYGWEISKQDMKNQIQLDEGAPSEYEIIFDVEPKKIKTNLKQLERIYLFSHNYNDTSTYWTVMMLKLRPILFDENKILNKQEFTPNRESSEETEFLYLRESWTYGSVGRMNAAIIEPEARDYFRKFF